jgi:hypothetical protein
MEGLDPTPLTPNVKTRNYTAEIDKKISIAKAARPQAKLFSIQFDDKPAPIQFYFRDNSRVFLNPDSLKIEKTMSPETHWIHILYPFHSGRLFGFAHIFIVITIGLTAVSLITTGLLSAFNRGLVIQFLKKRFSVARIRQTSRS